MIYTDYLFVPFVLLIAAVYFIIPLRLRWLVLLMGSIWFYLTWGLELFPYVCGAVFLVWISSLLIEYRQKKCRGAETRVRRGNRWILSGTVVAVVLILIYVKSQRYFAEQFGLVGPVWFFSKVYQHSIRWLLKIPLLDRFVLDVEEGAVFTEASFFMPLGISYYTMSLVGYLADVYWKKERAEKNILKLFLFAIWFPKILEGPISKYRNVAEQLYAGHGFDYRRFCFGLQRMLWGLFKKLVIADRLDIFVRSVFDNYEVQYGAILFIAAIFGAFDLYCDFSGCMDIALGVSEIFGITLEENFRRPFFSSSAAEFWRRWHITLGIWFKDYVYMPLVVLPQMAKLSGFVKKRFGRRTAKGCMTVIPLAIVWLLTGLWHGTGMNYIVWGIYWGLLMILSEVFAPEIRRLSAWLHLPTEHPGYQRFRIIRTFFLFVISRIITLPSDIAASAAIFKRIVTDIGIWQVAGDGLYGFGLDRRNFNFVLVMLTVLYFVSKKQEEGICFRDKIAELPIVIRWAFYLGCVMFVLVFGAYGPGYSQSAFVYMNY